MCPFLSSVWPEGAYCSFLVPLPLSSSLPFFLSSENSYCALLCSKHGRESHEQLAGDSPCLHMAMVWKGVLSELRVTSTRQGKHRGSGSS